MLLAGYTISRLSVVDLPVTLRGPRNEALHPTTCCKPLSIFCQSLWLLMRIAERLARNTRIAPLQRQPLPVGSATAVEHIPRRHVEVALLATQRYDAEPVLGYT